MPIYEYSCNDCGQLFEEWQKDFQEREVSCPVCGGKSERLISNTSFVLKGGGWYATDYCRGSSNSSSKDNGGSGKKKSTEADASKGKPAVSSSAGNDQASSKAS